MISPYSPEIPEDALLRLKGQLHCHWYDDGQLPNLLGLGEIDAPFFDLSCKPVEVAHRYHDLGYDFLAFTEHNVKEVIDYTRARQGYGTPGTCLVAATSEVQTRPTFIEILQSEEVTAAHHHVLALGVRDEVTQRDCQDDPPFARLAEAVAGREAGVAFLPHPRQYYDAAYEDFYQEVTLDGSTQTRFSAISVRTAASALLHKDSLCLWDVLLNQEIWTRTADGRAILLPAYSEDDYAPLGIGPVEILRPGSTWIEVEIDSRVHSWPRPEEDANGVRSATLLGALQSGRWWTYWVEGGHPWPRDRAYPRLTLHVDEDRQTITVTSDQTLSRLSFITDQGMTRPDERGSVSAGEPVTYAYQGHEIYVRVAAEYEDSGYIVRVCGNPVWVRAPEVPESGRVAPLTGEGPTVTLAPDLPIFEGETTIGFKIEGAVIHAPVRLDTRIVGYAKPVAGSDWQAKVDASSYPTGSYALQVEVVDRQGRSARAIQEVEVRSDAAASAISIHRQSLPATPQTGLAQLTGRVSPVYKGARLAGVVVQVDHGMTYESEVRGEGWSCWLPPESFTRGPHTIEATALYARTSQKAEMRYDIG